MSTTGVTPEQSSWIDRTQYRFPSNQIVLDSGRMHYVDEGAGEPILFVHGAPTWSFLWRVPIRELSTEFRCIAPDLMGFGLSDKPKDFHYCAFDQSRALDQLVRHLDLQNITLVAHDYGGPIGFGSLTDEPERYKRVVLMNTWLWDLTADPETERVAKAAQGPLGKLHFGQSGFVSKQMKSGFADKNRWTECLESAYSGPFQGKNDRVGLYEMARCLQDSGPWFNELWSCRSMLADKPLMLLWGAKDPCFGEKALNRIWHEFPLAEVHLIEDAGHYPMEEHPGEVTMRIREFMRAVRPQTYLA